MLLRLDRLVHLGEGGMISMGIEEEEEEEEGNGGEGAQDGKGGEGGEVGLHRGVRRRLGRYRWIRGMWRILFGISDRPSLLGLALWRRR